MPRINSTFASLAAALACLPRAHACAVCMGTAESTQQQGLNAGLVTMLGIMSVVFGAIVFAVVRMVLLARGAALESPDR